MKSKNTSSVSNTNLASELRSFIHVKYTLGFEGLQKKIM